MTKDGQGGHSSPGAEWLWGCRITAGSDEKSQNVTRTFFNRVHLLPTGLRFEYVGTKFASCPGRHLTSLRPCVQPSASFICSGLGRQNGARDFGDTRISTGHGSITFYARVSDLLRLTTWLLVKSSITVSLLILYSTFFEKCWGFYFANVSILYHGVCCAVHFSWRASGVSGSKEAQGRQSRTNMFYLNNII